MKTISIVLTFSVLAVLLSVIPTIALTRAQTDNSGGSDSSSGSSGSGDNSGPSDTSTSSSGDNSAPNSADTSGSGSGDNSAPNSADTSGSGSGDNSGGGSSSSSQPTTCPSSFHLEDGKCVHNNLVDAAKRIGELATTAKTIGDGVKAACSIGLCP